MNKFTRNATQILWHLSGSLKMCRKRNVNKMHFQTTCHLLYMCNLVQFSQTPADPVASPTVIHDPGYVITLLANLFLSLSLTKIMKYHTILFLDVRYKKKAQRQLDLEEEEITIKHQQQADVSVSKICIMCGKTMLLLTVIGIDLWSTYQESKINAGKETNSHQRLISRQSGPDGHFDEV